jgi:hypothetical protein
MAGAGHGVDHDSSSSLNSLRNLFMNLTSYLDASESHASRDAANVGHLPPSIPDEQPFSNGEEQEGATGHLTGKKRKIGTASARWKILREMVKKRVAALDQLKD